MANRMLTALGGVWFAVAVIVLAVAAGVLWPFR